MLWRPYTPFVAKRPLSIKAHWPAPKPTARSPFAMWDTEPPAGSCVVDATSYNRPPFCWIPYNVRRMMQPVEAWRMVFAGHAPCVTLFMAGEEPDGSLSWWMVDMEQPPTCSPATIQGQYWECDWLTDQSMRAKLVVSAAPVSIDANYILFALAGSHPDDTIEWCDAFHCLFCV